MHWDENQYLQLFYGSLLGISGIILGGVPAPSEGHEDVLFMTEEKMEPEMVRRSGAASGPELDLDLQSLRHGPDLWIPAEK